MDKAGSERASIVINCWFIQIELDLQQRRVYYRIILPFIGSILRNRIMENTSEQNLNIGKNDHQLPIVHYVY